MVTAASTIRTEGRTDFRNNSAIYDGGQTLFLASYFFLVFGGFDYFSRLFTCCSLFLVLVLFCP